MRRLYRWQLVICGVENGQRCDDGSFGPEDLRTEGDGCPAGRGSVTALAIGPAALGSGKDGNGLRLWRDDGRDADSGSLFIEEQPGAGLVLQSFREIERACHLGKTSPAR